MNWTFRIPSSFAKQLSWTETLVWPKYWGKNNILRLYSLTHSTKWWLSSSIPKIGGKKTFQNSLKTFVRPLIEAIKYENIILLLFLNVSSLSHIILWSRVANSLIGFSSDSLFFLWAKELFVCEKEQIAPVALLSSKSIRKNEFFERFTRFLRAICLNHSHRSFLKSN